MWIKGKVYKPVEELDLSDKSEEILLRIDVLAPRATGLFLKLFVWGLESYIIGPIVMSIMKAGNLIYKLFAYALIKDLPMYFPKFPEEEFEEPEVASIDCGLSPLERVSQVVDCLPGDTSSTLIQTAKGQLEDEQPFFKRWTIRDFSRAYLSGNVTPTQVAERFISSVKQSSGMCIFINCDPGDILRQAAESTMRYKKVLDGVPIAVKDEIDCLPYPTTGGTRWLHKNRKVTDDATCVRRLRECGAVLVGKTNMHELGIGTSGINPHYGATRNPYDDGRISGGSSSGSAAAVSAGLCPAALGVDGGGSVRMPAAMCGVVGLKPTYGRIPHLGVLPFNWTVGMVGVLAATVEDALIVYAAVLEHLPTDRLVSFPPHIRLPLLKNNKSVANLKLAKYTKWFEYCDIDIRNTCQWALNLLQCHYGCKTLEVTLPELEEMRLAHYITIGCECDASLGVDFAKLGMKRSGGDTRIALHVYKNFSSREFLNAQRIRSRQMYIHMEIFKKANVIVTPTTGVTAYRLQEDALSYGEFDYANGAAMLRYQVAGNFLGLPAVTVPIGYDKFGMPIGLQFIGRPWSEATLLRLAYATEVIKDRKWKEITCAFNFAPTTTSASFGLRKYYMTLLRYYEHVYFFQKKGQLPAAPLSTVSPVPQSSDNGSAHAGSDEKQPEVKKRKKRTLPSLPSPIVGGFPIVGVDPTSSVDQPVTGVIDGKFEYGYLVTVKLGSDILRGVLYHKTSESLGAQFAGISCLQDSNVFDTTASGNSTCQKKKKERIKKRDPNHPKPNRSGYNFFFAEQHARLKALHPDKDREISKMIGELWNKLSEEERGVYQDFGLKDKERYKKEMQEYKERLNVQSDTNEVLKQQFSKIPVSDVDMMRLSTQSGRRDINISAEQKYSDQENNYKEPIVKQ